MNDKEKYLAEIESRLVSFGTTIEEITNKEKMRNYTRPKIEIDHIQDKHARAHEAFRDLKTSDDEDWDSIKNMIDRMMGDIDQDLRTAMAHFK